MVNMGNIQYFKLNKDDILEIVSTFIAEKTGINEFTTKSIILGTSSEKLRMVVAVGDSDLSDVNLEEIDKNIDFNGEHSKAKGLTNEELLAALDKMILTGEF